MSLPDPLRDPALAPLWRAVHERFGRGGAVREVRVGPLDDLQRSALADLLGLARLPGQYAAVRLDRLDAALEEAGVADARQVVVELLGEVLDRRMDRDQDRRERAALWEWFAGHPVVGAEPALLEWVRRCRSRGLVGGSVLTTRRLLRDALAVLEALPGDGVPLSVLADRVLRDPHALDPGRPVAGLVLSALASRYGLLPPANAKDRRLLWDRAGVAENEVSSTVLVAGFRPHGAGLLPTILRACADAGQAASLTLAQVRGPGALAGVDGDVWVVENPTVLEVFVRRLGRACPPCVCTSGWPSGAAIRLLGVLPKARLHYHGDFDGDGLRIAADVMARTGAHPWRYGAADYLAALGDRSGGSAAGRISPSPWDRHLADALSARGVAVYEEELVDLLTDDLRAAVARPRDSVEDQVMTDDSKIIVSRTFDLPAPDIFEVLSLPARHPELDGSGFVRSDEKTDRITAVGQVFTMNMEGPHMGGEYKTENHVVGYDRNKLLAWKTAPAGTEPPGWEWVWELKADGSNSTEVTLTYDWSAVTDKELLKKVSFPLVSEAQLEDSLSNLAAAVSGDR